MHPAPPAAGHPCVCRERLWLTGANIGCDGASLRVRGAALRRADDPTNLRVIAACAGSGGVAPAPVRVRQRHPCVCGERSADGYVNTEEAGVIPACAGNRAGRPGGSRG